MPEGLRRVFTVLAVGFILFGVGVALYPTIADKINQMQQDENIVVYNTVVQDMDTSELDRMWAAAKEYNKKIKNSGLFRIVDDAEYNDTLNVAGDGLIGYVEVKDQNIRLPIYHGTEDEVLDTAVGHLEGTSLPTDGKGVLSIITGHTGLVNLDLFTDIHNMEQGDTFTVSTLNRILTYEVDDIQTVWPEEMYDLSVDSNENYCMLVTCTPYGVNDHRLLVRGKLMDVTTTGETEETISSYALQKLNTAGFDLIQMCAAGLIVIIVIFLLVLGIKTWRDNRY